MNSSLIFVFMVVATSFDVFSCFELLLNNKQEVDKDKAMVVKPIMKLLPSVIHLSVADNRVPLAYVSVLNIGGGELIITSVKPSCDCASATVLASSVFPMTIGKIRLSVNTKNFSDTLSHVDFMIESNSINSPQVFSLWVHKK